MEEITNLIIEGKDYDAMDLAAEHGESFEDCRMVLAANQPLDVSACDSGFESITDRDLIDEWISFSETTDEEVYLNMGTKKFLTW